MTETSTTAAPAPSEDFKTIHVVFRTARHGQATPAAYVQTLLFTDQSPQAALASLAAYYREPELLGAPATLDMLVSAGAEDDYAFVYFTPENAQVVMDNNTFAGLVIQNGDSIKGAVDFLNQAVGKLLSAAQPRTPDEEMVRIHRLDFHLAPATEPAAEQEA